MASTKEQQAQTMKVQKQSRYNHTTRHDTTRHDTTRHDTARQSERAEKQSQQRDDSTLVQQSATQQESGTTNQTKHSVGWQLSANHPPPARANYHNDDHDGDSILQMFSSQVAGGIGSWVC